MLIMIDCSGALVRQTHATVKPGATTAPSADGFLRLGSGLRCSSGVSTNEPYRVRSPLQRAHAIGLEQPCNQQPCSQQPCSQQLRSLAALQPAAVQPAALQPAAFLGVPRFRPGPALEPAVSHQQPCNSCSVSWFRCLGAGSSPLQLFDPSRFVR